jgi:3-methyladenine DNA glycosylase AlkD
MAAPLTARVVERALATGADPIQARFALRFFKTGPGEYGEGDRFLGLRLPALRAAVKTYAALPLAEVRRLLKSPWHEVRLVALLILVRQYARGDERRRAAIYRLYLRHTRAINNWDLVDASAPHIVGPHWRAADPGVLRRLASSSSVWERRIAMLATLHDIRRDDYRPALQIATRLLADRHDLIHKAAGWMLREVGKRDRAVLEAFLRRHAHHMPRTMLRYAIERLPPRQRAQYMRAKAAARLRDASASR